MTPAIYAVLIMEISAQLAQEQEAPAPSKTAATRPIASPKKSTITCVKSKLVKKIIGVNPKCPSGYKKK